MLTPALLCLSLLAAAPQADRLAAVNAVLDDWHRAAASADEARSFSHFTQNGVFLGTDGTERWTRDAFRTWAHPHFARGKAWSFTPHGRQASFSRDGSVAWFDEALDTPNMGPCRGSGVLVLEGGAWRIAQYNLAVPIPNALVRDVVARIAAQGKAQK